MNTLTYRPAQIEDFDDFYHIKADKQNIAWGGFTEAPNRETFYSWFQKQLVSNTRSIYLVFADSSCCAFFYIDKIDDTTYELSSSGVLSEYCGKGIGTYTVEKRIELIKAKEGKQCITWISENNIASYKRFEKNGFIRTEEFEVRTLPQLGGENKFYKWIKEL